MHLQNEIEFLTAGHAFSTRDFETVAKIIDLV